MENQNQEIKKVENFLKKVHILPTSKVEIRIFGCTPDSYGNPGHWDCHEHKLLVDVYGDICDDDAILLSCKSGNFEVEVDEDNCDIDESEIFDKESLVLEAKSYDKLEDFIDSIQDDVKRNNTIYYYVNCRDEDEDEDYSDAIYEIIANQIRYQGHIQKTNN